MSWTSPACKLQCMYTSFSLTTGINNNMTPRRRRGKQKTQGIAKVYFRDEQQKSEEAW